jgi:glycolate oxidase FAD binding subunit
MIWADSEAQVIDSVRWARETKSRFEIVGAGTRRSFGRPVSSQEILDVSGLKGILNYEPEELILTVAPGTPIAEIESVLTEKGQRLGFDPADWSALFGTQGRSTIGGAVSADACGPGRVRYGGPRDSLLGIRAVNGLGEAFKAGGRVVKNVTGFDIPKLVCGAMGTLCVLTELTFRVFPKAPLSATLAVRDVAPGQGLALLRRIWSGPLEPTGLAYLPVCAELGDVGQGVALFRIEGESHPLNEKVTMLRAALAGYDIREVAEGDASFSRIGSGAVFSGTAHDVWRVALPPSQAAGVAQAVGAPLWYADWAGAMLWIGLKPNDDFTVERLQSLACNAGGHASLLRAGAKTRGRVGVFPPLPPAHEALSRVVKAAFDPLSLFNPGRMVEGL